MPVKRTAVGRIGRWLLRILPGLLMVLGGVVLVVVLAKILPARDRSQPPQPAPAVNVTTVALESIERPDGSLRPGVYANLPDTISLPGVAEPWATIPLAAEVDGRIQEIRVRKGDEVAAGQVMIVLDTELLQAAYQQARAQAQRDQAELERTQQVFERGVITPTELTRAQAAARASQAALEAAETRLRHAEIKAPLSPPPGLEPAETMGVVNDLPVEPGQYIAPGQRVAELVVMRSVKIMVDIPELDVRYLRVGQPVDVTVEALDDFRTTGTVWFIPRTADPRTRTYRVEMRVDNPAEEPGKRILAGMVARVELVRQVLHDVVMIPLDAVIPLEHGYEVYVAVDGEARQRQVRPGLIRGRFVQALPLHEGSGLQAGDRLIVDGQRLVADGQPIADRAAGEVLLEAASSPEAMTRHVVGTRSIPGLDPEPGAAPPTAPAAPAPGAEEPAGVPLNTDVPSVAG